MRASTWTFELFFSYFKIRQWVIQAIKKIVFVAEPAMRIVLQKHLWLRTVINHTFHAWLHPDTFHDFTVHYMRHELAFRSWMRKVDVDLKFPIKLLLYAELDSVAIERGTERGYQIWWTWPIWSTCAHCASKESIRCEECDAMVSFALFYDCRHRRLLYGRQWR